MTYIHGTSDGDADLICECSVWLSGRGLNHTRTQFLGSPLSQSDQGRRGYWKLFSQEKGRIAQQESVFFRNCIIEGRVNIRGAVGWSKQGFDLSLPQPPHFIHLSFRLPTGSRWWNPRRCGQISRRSVCALIRCVLLFHVFRCVLDRHDSGVEPPKCCCCVCDSTSEIFCVWLDRKSDSIELHPSVLC